MKGEEQGVESQGVELLFGIIAAAPHLIKTRNEMSLFRTITPLLSSAVLLILLIRLVTHERRP